MRTDPPFSSGLMWAMDIAFWYHLYSSAWPLPSMPTSRPSFAGTKLFHREHRPWWFASFSMSWCMGRSCITPATSIAESGWESRWEASSLWPLQTFCGSSFLRLRLLQPIMLSTTTPGKSWDRLEQRRHEKPCGTFIFWCWMQHLLVDGGWLSSAWQNDWNLLERNKTYPQNTLSPRCIPPGF